MFASICRLALLVDGSKPLPEVFRFGGRTQRCNAITGKAWRKPSDHHLFRGVTWSHSPQVKRIWHLCRFLVSLSQTATASVQHWMCWLWGKRPERDDWTVTHMLKNSWFLTFIRIFEQLPKALHTCRWSLVLAWNMLFTQHVWPIGRRARWKAWRQLILTTQPPREHWRVRGRLRFGYIICIIIYIYIWMNGMMWWGTERQTCLKFWKNWSDCSSCACETSHLETTLNHILFHRSSKRMILIRFTVPSAESGRFHLAKEGEASGVPQNEVLIFFSENNLWIQVDHVLPSCTQLGETCFTGCLWVWP